MSILPDLLVVSIFGAQFRAFCASTEMKSTNAAAFKFSLWFYSIARSLRFAHSFVVHCKHDPFRKRDGLF